MLKLEDASRKEVEEAEVEREKRSKTGQEAGARVTGGRG